MSVNRCHAHGARAVATLAALGLMLGRPALSAAADPLPAPENVPMVRLFALARAALGGTPPPKLEKHGTVTAAGLSGTILCRQDGADQYCDTQVGPLTEHLQRKDGVYYRSDVSGLVRRLNGSMLMHERTEAAIEDFSFLAHPEWAKPTVSNDSDALAVLVHAPGGDTERVIFDRSTKHVSEVISNADDGRQTLQFNDYRNVGGMQMPFQIAIERSGGQAYSITFSDITATPIFTSDAFAVPQSERVVCATIQTVPLSIRDEHLYVPVSLNGQRYTFLLDSGSRTMVLDHRVANAIGFVARGDILLRGAKNMSGMGFGTIAGLDIAGAHFGPQFAVVTNLATTSDGTSRIDGIIGFPIFAQSVIELDPKLGIMRLGEPGSLRFPGPHADISLDRGIIEVDGSMAHGPAHTQFILDTGSSDTLAIYDGFARRYPDAVHVGAVSERTYGVGGSIAAQNAQIAALHISGLGTFAHLDSHILRSQEGAFADRLVAGNLGMSIFADTILGFDLQNGVVSFGVAPVLAPSAGAASATATPDPAAAPNALAKTVRAKPRSYPRVTPIP